MMQSRLLFAKRLVIVLMTLLCTLSMTAQRGYRTNGGVSHYLTLQLGGGESNTLATSEKVTNLKNLGGADAQFAFHYEIRKNFFFFNFGAAAHYTYTGQNIASFSDAFAAKTYQNVAHTYRYNYTNYEEHQHTLAVGVPVQFGFYIIPEFYVAVGARAEYPLLANYETNTMLMTDGLFPQFIQPFQNNAQYGFYPETLFATTGKYMVGGMQPTISPTLELGTRFRLGGPVSLRLGVYAEYAIPLLQVHAMPLTDYSSVIATSNPLHSQEQLWSSLRLNSILDHNAQTRDYSRLSVGIKATLLFNLKSKPHCVTCDDDSGISYQQPKHIRKRNDLKYRRW